MNSKFEPSPLVEQPILSREFERSNQSKLFWKGGFPCSSYSLVSQSKMTTDLKQLCFELIEMQPFLDETVSPSNAFSIALIELAKLGK